LGNRRISAAVQDLFVSLRITVRNRVTSWESLSGLNLLLLVLVVSTGDDGKFVDGDVSAGVGNSRKNGSVTIRLNTDCGIVEGDTGGGGNVWGRSWGGWRDGATGERTRGQTKETRGDIGMGMGLGRGCREIQGNGSGSGNGNVFCADSMTTI
jgi:hypothetical protein